jgi:opacity protein-like surface antigen
MAAAITVSAAESPKKSLLETLSVSAVGAYQQAEWSHGPGSWGAGVDLGLPVNKFVSLHVRNLAFDGEDTWGGSVIDETAVYGRADFKPFSTDRFYLFGTGGGARHWDVEDWSFGIGLGVEYRFTKNISLSVAREIRAKFKGEQDWLSTAALTWRF